jgi:hypothetical protein
MDLALSSGNVPALVDDHGLKEDAGCTRFFSRGRWHFSHLLVDVQRPMGIWIALDRGTVLGCTGPPFVTEPRSPNHSDWCGRIGKSAARRSDRSIGRVLS